MADVEFAVASARLASGNLGQADFTVSGFGTPKACLVFFTNDPTDDTSVEAQSRASIGFSDFTNNFCIAHQDEDGSAKVDCDSIKSNTVCYQQLDASGSGAGSGTASAITDGVRLTNGIPGVSGGGFATVVFFGGTDLQVDVGEYAVNSAQDGAGSAQTTSIDQSLIFFIGVDINSPDSAGSGINNSYGVVHIDTSDHTTFTQRCISWASDHNAGAAAPSESIRNNRALSIITETGGLDWGLELTAATATSFTMTTRDAGAGNGMEVYYLAISLGDAGSAVGSVDAPTAGATWTPSVSLGFTPQYVGLGLVRTTAENVIVAQGSVGISSVTGTGEETCHSWYNEDAADPTNTNSLFRSRAIDLRDGDVATVSQDQSFLSFNSGDWTYTINSEDETNPLKWWYVAVEEGTGPPAGFPAGGVHLMKMRASQ